MDQVFCRSLVIATVIGMGLCKYWSVQEGNAECCREETLFSLENIATARSPGENNSVS